MRTVRFRPVALAIVCIAFPLSLAAKPGGPKKHQAVAKSKVPTPMNATGMGKRDPGLAYVSVPRRAFMPSAFVTSALIAKTGSIPSLDNEHTRYESGSAVVHLPDGARLRTLACFGSQWRPDKNKGFGVKLSANGLNAQAGEEIGRAKVIGGDGKRRLVAELDHVVDNFNYGYELRMNLNVDAHITGCRIGYERQ